MDRDQCRSEMNSTQSQIRSQESLKAELEEKIRRLETAYSKITGIKETVKVLQSEVNEKENQEDTWKGEEYEWYTSFITDYFGTNYKTYYNNLDDYHDAILEEKTRLQNQLNETAGAIGWLKSRWNDLSSWWSQLTN